MRLEIEVDDFVYRDIHSHCVYCGIDEKEYIASLIADGHTASKFGAVPPMFAEKEPPRPVEAPATEAGPTHVQCQGSEPKAEPDAPKQENKPKRTRKTIAAK